MLVDALEEIEILVGELWEEELIRLGGPALGVCIKIQFNFGLNLNEREIYKHFER